LPVTGPIRVLVTTRLNYLARHGCRTLELPALDETSSLTLLQARRHADSGSEAAAARQIAELLGHHPLALDLAGQFIGRRRLAFADYEQRLRETPDRFRLLEEARRVFINSTHHDGSIYDAIALTHRNLSADAQRVLAAASCFAPRAIPGDLLRATTEIAAPDDFEEALAELQDVALLSRDADDRLSYHVLVGTFAFGAMPAEQQAETVERVARVLAASVTRDNEALDWNWTRRELSHCECACALVARHGSASALHPHAFGLGKYFYEHEEPEKARACLQVALAAAQSIDTYLMGKPSLL
jgi:hypothetical protein